MQKKLFGVSVRLLYLLRTELLMIKTSPTFHGLIRVSMFVFLFTDTGEGISEENIRKIFDPYFSTKKKETGSGLGLYVTYGIIKAHMGILM